MDAIGGAGLAHHLRVGPGPGFTQTRQFSLDVRRAHPQGRQRPLGRHFGCAGFAALSDDQHQPWPQATVVVGQSRREHPRKIRRIKIDDGQVIGLIVAGVRARVRAQDKFGVDGDHVTGPVQVHHGRNHCRACVGTRQCHADLHRGAGGQGAKIVLQRQGSREAAAHPGQKLVGDRSGGGHGLTPVCSLCCRRV